MKFQVFRDGKVIDKFDPCGAYLFGADGIAIRRARIEFSKGVIECAKPSDQTAGLVMLWPVDGFGKVMLSTTTLPERDKPYNLNVEIARAKLMQIINKREDWSFFSNIEGLTNISNEAQALFIKAVQNISDPPMASKLADEALKKAIVFSEKLAVKQAEIQFKTRGQNRGFGRGCLGCKIDIKQIGKPKYFEKLTELFSYVTIPINWAQIEPRQGVYDFSAIDACVKLLGKKRLAVGAGPLLRFSEEYLPDWLMNGPGEFERIRDMAYQFISKVVTRYANIIRAWRVTSGLNTFNHFGFNFEQILEMTRAANMAVKASSVRSLKIIEVSNPWGEYYATTPNTIPPLVYVDMVVQSGINFDAFGLQVRMGKDQDGMHVRDMMQISAVLDYFGAVAKPLYITEVEVPSDSAPKQGEQAGIWHENWSPAMQARWIEQFYKIALSKPFVDTVTYANMVDVNGGIIDNSGLLTDKLQAKDSYKLMKKLHKVIFTR